MSIKREIESLYHDKYKTKIEELWKKFTEFEETQKVIQVEQVQQKVEIEESARSYKLEQEHIDEVYFKIRDEFYKRLDDERNDLSENSLVVILFPFFQKSDLKVL